MDPAPAPVDLASLLGSLPAIAVATTFLVSPLWRIVSDVPGLKKVPMFIYVSAVAIVLTLFASWLGFIPIDWSSPQAVVELLLASAMTAIGASGARDWFQSGSTTPEVMKEKHAPTLSNSGAPLIIVGGLLLFSTLTGCASLTASQRYQIASETYRTTLLAVVEARTEGLLDDEDMEKLRPIKEELSEMFDLWEQALIQGDVSTAATYEDRVAAKLKVFKEEADVGSSQDSVLIDGDGLRSILTDREGSGRGSGIDFGRISQYQVAS